MKLIELGQMSFAAYVFTFFWGMDLKLGDPFVFFSDESDMLLERNLLGSFMMRRITLPKRPKLQIQRFKREVSPIIFREGTVFAKVI